MDDFTDVSYPTRALMMMFNYFRYQCRWFKEPFVLLVREPGQPFFSTRLNLVLLVNLVKHFVDSLTHSLPKSNSLPAFLFQKGFIMAARDFAVDYDLLPNMRAMIRAFKDLYGWKLINELYLLWM